MLKRSKKIEILQNNDAHYTDGKQFIFGAEESALSYDERGIKMANTLVIQCSSRKRK